MSKLLNNTTSLQEVLNTLQNKAVNGGQAGSTIELDTTLAVAGKAADAAAVGEAISQINEALHYTIGRNLFDCHYSETEQVDGLTITYTNGYASNYVISTTTGVISESTTKQISYMIPINGGAQIYFQQNYGQTSSNVGYVYFYDINGTYISASLTDTSGTVLSPENAAYIRLVAAAIKTQYFMVNYDGTVGAPYEEYKVGYHIADDEVRNALQTFDTTEKADLSKNDKVYNENVVESLRSDLTHLREFIYSMQTPIIRDSGLCGENLTWELYSDGLLKIRGTGRSYDFIKGVMIGKNTDEVNAYVSAHPDSAFYGFREGGNYYETTASDGTYIGYVAPWYRYRKEVFAPNETSNGYCSKAHYDEYNPNGWTYNRIEIDEGITYIGDWMFYRVCGTTELVIPNTVTEIGEWAIRFSPTLKCVYLPDSVTTIGLRGCSRLAVATAIRVGSSLVNIGDYAFSNNPKIGYLKIAGNIESIGVNLFEGNTELNHVTFDGLTSLNAYDCVRCAKLERVDLPETLTSIGEGTFFKTGLKSIRIPETVTTINTVAFHQCSNLTDVYIDSPTIAAGLKEDYSYGNLCVNAKRVYVKNTIKTVGSFLLNKCTKCIEVGDYILYVRN